jgi:D-xylulose reductase
MKAIFLEEKGVLSPGEFDDSLEIMGSDDVRIKIHTVGVCGSDLHYYKHGHLGRYVVKEPLILGHEASGEVLEVGANVTTLEPGDRVCMEPGVPDPKSKAYREGNYNLDLTMRFWAAPPDHGVLRESVVHPADFTYKLPENVSYGEGALVEPLAVGMHAATKAEIKPGDIALVIGAGTIGAVTTLAALAGGCSLVILADIVQEKLDMVSPLGSIVPVNVTKENLTDVVFDLTNGWGADIIFEASGSQAAGSMILDPLCPGGRVMYIGVPEKPVAIDMAYAIYKEARIQSIRTYAHVFPRALALMESGKLNLKPLITDIYSFSDGIEAFDYACNPRPTSIKVQIVMDS